MFTLNVEKKNIYACKNKSTLQHAGLAGLTDLLAESVDVGDGAAAAGGWRVAGEAVERAVHEQDPRRARPADELVRAQEHRVVAVHLAGPHVDVHVGPTAQPHHS
jgi:hypothetical protein